MTRFLMIAFALMCVFGVQAKGLKGKTATVAGVEVDSFPFQPFSLHAKYAHQGESNHEESCHII